MAKRTKYKIFGIGLPKTGTTTLIAALKILGYDNYQPSNANFSKHSCFVGDSMFFHDYKELDKKYKNTRFILTLRRNPNVWFSSVSKWNKNPNVSQSKTIQNNRLAMYGHKFPTPENKNDWIQAYINRRIEIENYFQDKDNLLTVCWEDFKSMDNWYRLCNFVDKKIPIGFEFPHKNKNKA